MKQAKSEEVGEALINNVFSKYCVPDYMIKLFSFVLPLGLTLFLSSWGLIIPSYYSFSTS